MKASLKLDHHNIHFIGCTHHGHTSVLKFDNRPFATIKEHDETLINNWNNKVKKTDIVFHLGDISFKSPKFTNSILEQLNGEIYLIKGNHDREKDINKLVNIKECFNGLDLYVEDETADDKLGIKQHIVLNHYPVLSWNRQTYSSWMIHSHSHQKLSRSPEYDWFYKRRVFDVGCNGIDYTPISYQEIKDIMLAKKAQLLNLNV